jgi:hypothetical protein
MKLLRLVPWILLFSECSTAQSKFYIQRGETISLVENADPDQINAKEWRVYLYKRNQPTIGNNYWGTLRGKSPKEVISKVHSNQDFEIQFNSFIGKSNPQNDIYTNFNPKGPVAILNDIEKSKKDNVCDEYMQIYDKTKRYYEIYKEVKKKMDVVLNGKEKSQYSEIGNTFKEYIGNLKSAVGTLLSLREILNSNSSKILDDIRVSISIIDLNLIRAENNIHTMKMQNDQRKNNNITNKSPGGSYMYFTATVIVPSDDFFPSGARATKSRTFISNPIPFFGAFQGNDNIKERKEFLSAINKVIPDVEISDSQIQATGFTEVNGNYEACQNAIKRTKESIINGWGGDSKRFQITNVEVKSNSGN